jgi:hypothetical protein
MLDIQSSDGVCIFLTEYKQPRAAILQKVFQFGSRQPEIEGHKNGAQTGTGQKKLDELGAIVQHRGNAIAFLDSQGL